MAIWLRSRTSMLMPRRKKNCTASCVRDASNDGRGTVYAALPLSLPRRLTRARASERAFVARTPPLETPVLASWPPLNPQVARKQLYTKPSPFGLIVTARLFSRELPPRHFGHDVRWLPALYLGSAIPSSCSRSLRAGCPQRNFPSMPGSASTPPRISFKP